MTSNEDSITNNDDNLVSGFDESTCSGEKIVTYLKMRKIL